MVIYMLHSIGKCQIESSCLDKQRSTQFQSSSARGSQSFTNLAFMPNHQFSRAENIIIRTMRMLAMVELIIYQGLRIYICLKKVCDSISTMYNIRSLSFHPQSPFSPFTSCTFISVPTQNFLPLQTTSTPPTTAHAQIGKANASRTNHASSHCPGPLLLQLIRPKTGRSSLSPLC